MTDDPTAPRSRDFAIRPLNAGDTEAILDLHSAMDHEDRVRRFLFEPNTAELEKAAAVAARADPTHGAVGAFVDGRLVGVANFVTLEGTDSAEVALVVAHDRQEHGIGTELLHHLARLAREHGIRRFVADVMPTNSKMMRLLIDADFPILAHRHDGLARVSAQL
ncbi:GNAT family N-acetyltransferase [Nocardia sp.]|uniref:GNAT family N-acetyltransferase n=1 Tax=Nocardia sp. TaxID=1821 RepID=UPI00258D23AD|nr:GNAT family N-acetyltransferase [Nocardia sp.]